MLEFDKKNTEQLCVKLFLVQKHLTEFPQPEDLCDYHRQVYHDNIRPCSGKQIAGAAAFEVNNNKLPFLLW